MNPRLRWKTRAFAAIVILSNAFGNLFLDLGHAARADKITASPLSFLRAIFNPWVSFGICLLIAWMLSKMFLLSWADLSYVLPVTAFGYVLNAALGPFVPGGKCYAGSLGRNAAHYGRGHSSGPGESAIRAARDR